MVIVRADRGVEGGGYEGRVRVRRDPQPSSHRLPFPFFLLVQVVAPSCLETDLWDSELWDSQAAW